MEDEFYENGKKMIRVRAATIGVIISFMALARTDNGRALMRNEKRISGRNYVLSRSFNEMAIGSDAKRTALYDPREAQREKWNLYPSGLYEFAGSLIEDISIPVETGTLSGFLYRPNPANAPVTGKTVVFFSGSGGPNASEGGLVAAVYNRLGTAVLGVDYRGFGRSNNREGLKLLTGATITEVSLYEDGLAVYNYVKNVMGVPSGDIILYGFSLGGAVASRTAALAAKQEDRLGGLVLHASIKNMTGAAAGTLPLIKPLAYAFGWLGGLLTGGSYNTRANLEELVKYDPDIPLHLRGGRKETGDQLGLDVTGLDRIQGFRNMSAYSGNESHVSTVIPGSMTALNLSEGTGDLAKMVYIKRT
jgi:pimeloyl-ACP methyl ester carboxylesterase